MLILSRQRHSEVARPAFVIEVHREDAVCRKGPFSQKQGTRYTLRRNLPLFRYRLQCLRVGACNNDLTVEIS